MIYLKLTTSLPSFPSSSLLSSSLSPSPTFVPPYLTLPVPLPDPSSTTHRQQHASQLAHCVHAESPHSGLALPLLRGVHRYIQHIRAVCLSVCFKSATFSLTFHIRYALLFSLRSLITVSNRIASYHFYHCSVPPQHISYQSLQCPHADREICHQLPPGGPPSP
jgi:hypothetical protein